MHLEMAIHSPGPIPTGSNSWTLRVLASAACSNCLINRQPRKLSPGTPGAPGGADEGTPEA